MSEENEAQQPIIIKKINKGHGGHHGGSWKVAFADFMTAMMAFFLVLWLVGQEDDIKKAVAGYFNDPIGFERGGKVGSGKGAGMMQGTEGLKDKKSMNAVVRQQMQEAANRIQQNLKLSTDFQALKDNVLIEMTPEGLRIQIVEGADSSFFEPGSARMSPTGEAILGLVAQEIGKLPNRIVFEGHTDASGSGNEFGYSNWDLGADRANFCRKVMLKNGVRKNQIKEVRSYADTRLLNEDDPLDPRNRRVSILVLNDYDYLWENKLVSLDEETGNHEHTGESDPPQSKNEPKHQDERRRDNITQDTAIDEETFQVPDYLLDDGLLEDEH